MKHLTNPIVGDVEIACAALDFVDIRPKRRGDGTAQLWMTTGSEVNGITLDKAGAETLRDWLNEILADGTFEHCSIG